MNPRTGKTRSLSVLVAEPVYENLRKEAKKRGVTLGQVVRERLAEAS